jgi:excinuclease ABC subunit A
MAAADWIVDVGKGAGVHGGNIIAQGTLQEILPNEESQTAAYLSGRRRIAIPEKRRPGNGKFLHIKGATGNNLKNVSRRSRSGP